MAKTAVQYDPALIHQYAEILYDRARRTELWWAISGALLGIGIGAAAGYFAAGKGGGSIREAWALVGACVGSLIIGVPARHIGRARAFRLRLEAQLVLCQVAIETGIVQLQQDTRRAAAVGTSRSHAAPAEPARGPALQRTPVPPPPPGRVLAGR